MSIDCRALPHDLVKLLHDTDKNVHRLLSNVNHTSYSNDVSKHLNHSTNNINSYKNNKSKSSNKDDVNTSPLHRRNKHDGHVRHLRHSSATSSQEIQMRTHKYKTSKQEHEIVENGASMISNKSLVERRRERLRTQMQNYASPQDDFSTSNSNANNDSNNVYSSSSSYEYEEEEKEYSVKDGISSYDDDDDGYETRIKEANLERRISEVNAFYSDHHNNSSISSTNDTDYDDTTDLYDEINKSTTNLNKKYAPPSPRMHKNRVSEQVRKLEPRSTQLHRYSQPRSVHKQHEMRLPSKSKSDERKHVVESNKRMYKLEHKMHSQFGKRWGRKFDTMLSQRAANTTHIGNDSTTKQNNHHVNESTTSTKEHNDVSVNKYNYIDKIAGIKSDVSVATKEEANKLGVALVTDHINNESNKGSENWPVTIANDEQMLASLREELRSKEEMILELKLAKAQEAALLRESITNVKAEAIQETTAQLTSTFQMKESLLEAKLKNEQEKLERLMKELTSEQEIRVKHERQLHETVNEINTLTGQITLLKNEAERARGHVSAMHKELQFEQQRVLELEQSVHQLQEKNSMLSTENNSLQLELTNLTERLLDKEKNTNEAMRKFEAEFTDTSSQYQNLLSEATTKMTYLEGVQRKYKALKEKFQMLEAEKVKLERSHKEFEEASTQRVAELQNELDHAKKEHDECLTEHATEVATLHDKISKLKLALEDTETHYANERATMQLELSEINQTLQERNATIATLQTELTNECNSHQQLVVQNAESELKTSNELAQLRQSSASYKVRAEEIISSLKRQLREKDVKLQALLATSTEPLQKLRAQLEDERGKRALAEDQLTRYKKQAKAAEEAILRELRKEQLRGTFTHNSQMTRNSSWLSSTKNKSLVESGVRTTDMNGENNIKLSVFTSSTNTTNVANDGKHEVLTPTNVTKKKSAIIKGTDTNKTSNSTLFALSANNDNILPRTWTDQARRLASSKEIYTAKNVTRAPLEVREINEIKNKDINELTQTSGVILPHNDDTIDSNHPPQTQVTLINESRHRDETHEYNNALMISPANEDWCSSSNNNNIITKTITTESMKESEANATPSTNKLLSNTEKVCAVLPEEEVSNSPALTIRDLSHISPASPCKSDVSSEPDKRNNNDSDEETIKTRRTSGERNCVERRKTQELSHSSENLEEMEMLQEMEEKEELEEEEEQELHEIGMTESNREGDADKLSNTIFTNVTRADIITPFTQTEAFNKSSEAILPYLPSQRTPHPQRKRPSPFTNSPSTRNTNSHVSTSPSYAPQSTANFSLSSSSSSSSSTFMWAKHKTEQAEHATNTSTQSNHNNTETLRNKRRTNNYNTAPVARLTPQVMPESSHYEQEQQQHHEENVKPQSADWHHKVEVTHDVNNAITEDDNVNITDFVNSIKNINNDSTSINHDIKTNNDSVNEVKNFQANATQVLNKITSSREAFLQQCTAIIRQSTSSC